MTSIRTDIAAAIQRASGDMRLSMRDLSLRIHDAAYRSGQFLVDIDAISTLVSSDALLGANAGVLADAIVDHFNLDEEKICDN